jgi:hypothetical protein
LGIGLQEKMARDRDSGGFGCGGGCKSKITGGWLNPYKGKAIKYIKQSH